jgi:hypothetical protein
VCRFIIVDENRTQEKKEREKEKKKGVSVEFFQKLWSYDKLK